MAEVSLILVIGWGGGSCYRVGWMWGGETITIVLIAQVIWAIVEHISTARLM